MIQRTIACALIVLAASAAGCASAGNAPAASPAFTREAECERNGGWWHPDIAYCEYQAPSGPSGPH